VTAPGDQLPALLAQAIAGTGRQRIDAGIGLSRFNTNRWQSPPGYEVGFDTATDQLRLGLDVVADCVNGR